MATTLSGKSGKCSNFGNCSLADARTSIEVPSGLDFVCSECGKPLLLIETGGGATGNSKALAVGALLLVLVLAAGGIGWSLLADKKKTPEPAPTPAPAAVVAPSAAESAAAAVAAAKAAAKAQGATPAPAPITGNCSEADERAGLCRLAR